MKISLPKGRALAFAASLVLAAAVSSLTPGCATSQQVTASTNSVGVVTEATNTVVNQVNLAIDVAAVQGVAAATATVILQKDPSTLVYFTDFETVLSGVINGSSTNSAAQIVATFSATPNATLASEIAPLVTAVSGLEQSLITKYGATVGGQIAIAIAKAMSTGVALAIAQNTLAAGVETPATVQVLISK